MVLGVVDMKAWLKYCDSSSKGASRTNISAQGNICFSLGQVNSYNLAIDSGEQRSWNDFPFLTHQLPQKNQRWTDRVFVRKILVDIYGGFYFLPKTHMTRYFGRFEP